MDHFAIVQALCRSAAAMPSEATTRQIERLRDALLADGNGKQAKALTSLLSATEKTKEMVPSRITASSSVRLQGEELTRNTSLPVDRETSVPLVQILFPEDLPIAPPYFAEPLRGAINSVLEGWQHFDRLRDADISPARSCLIFGAPGTGKTHLGHWMASKLGLPVVVARLDGLISSFLGTTSRNIGALFTFAARYRCLLLLDEFDSIAKLRNDPQEVGEIKRVVNTLLQHLDARAESGLTIGITNHEGLLDPAVWRRFEIQLEVPKPSLDARIAIIRRYLSPVALAETQIKILAWLTDGASGSEIETLVRMIKRNIVLGSSGKNFFEEMKQIAILSSGRIANLNRDLLLGDSKHLLSTLLEEPSLNLSQSDLAHLLNRDKSTVSRMLSKPTLPETEASELTHA